MSFYKARPNFEDRQVVQYSATSITLSGDTNIHPIGNLRIQKDAVPGYVAISLDSNGTVGWGPISGVSWSVSACTSPLYVNNLVSCPLTGGTIQVDAGSFDLNSELRFLISLSASPANNEVLVVDNSGYVQKVPNLMGVGNMWHVPVGYTLTIPDNYQSFIYGDILIEGTVDLQTNAELVILNGNLILSGGSIIGSGSTYLVTLGGGGSGTTIVQFTGNTSGTCITDFYVTNIYGCSPLHIQPLSGTGDVYIGEDGFVNVGVGTNAPTAKLHVVADNHIGSTMILKISDNISDRFTIKDDGTIDIVNNSGLYIDSTSTFNYANGAVDGYVLTSNSVGGASWQPLSGGTTIVPFTGNTSASCITDLYVTNIHGCSPIKIQPTSPDDIFMAMGGGNVGVGTESPIAKLHISGNSIINAGVLYVTESTITQTNINNFLDDSRGIVVRHIFTGNTGVAVQNTNTSGATIVSLNRGASKYISIKNLGDDFIRNAISPVNGFDFYRNKGVIEVGDNVNGLIINLNPSGNTSRLWFEQNANSPMVIAGGGAPSDLRLGIALNPDGTEIPTATLQVGGTGTTGTVQVNQDVLNVNSYNAYGKIRPNYYTSLFSGSSTSGTGIYNITIPAGWVIEQIQIHTKVLDSVLTVGSLVSISTGSFNVWFPATPRPFGMTTNQIVNMIGTYGGTYVEPAYFPSGDTLLVSFVDSIGTPTNITDGYYNILITYWDGTEIL